MIISIPFNPTREYPNPLTTKIVEVGVVTGKQRKFKKLSADQYKIVKNVLIITDLSIKMNSGDKIIVSGG